MEYTEIDLKNWERKEYYTHYLSAVPCTYSMTVKLDITALRQAGDKLYPAMLYLLTGTVNSFPQFRMNLRPDGKLVQYREMHPAYTIFHKDSGTFSSIWTEYSADYQTFFRRYQEDVRRYENVKAFSPKPDTPENCFDVSMIPWTAFESFQLNIAEFRYLLPIFTMGRYQEEGGRCLLPLAVQVHHAVCDGFHLSCFLQALQEKLNAWGKREE